MEEEQRNHRQYSDYDGYERKIEYSIAYLYICAYSIATLEVVGWP
jgi:hypothetical protein